MYTYLDSGTRHSTLLNPSPTYGRHSTQLHTPLPSYNSFVAMHFISRKGPPPTPEFVSSPISICFFSIRAWTRAAISLVTSSSAGVPLSFSLCSRLASVVFFASFSAIFSSRRRSFSRSFSSFLRFSASFLASSFCRLRSSFCHALSSCASAFFFWIVFFAAGCGGVYSDMSDAYETPANVSEADAARSVPSALSFRRADARCAGRT
mmetsp:Transcript_11567/g.48446  ORF Transcript_11567/g.48446 Transcript_11567/m.48446 type:complete len:207 (+) Transcript_11567:1741-2361(+)